MASEAQLLFSAIGFFVIVGVLLGLSGVAGPNVLVPNSTTGSVEGSTDPGAHVNCGFLFQWFCDLGSFTIHLFVHIADVLSYVGAFVFFFFQLLTYQLPIPAWLNTIVVLPPAIMVIYVGIRFIRGGG